MNDFIGELTDDFSRERFMSVRSPGENVIALTLPLPRKAGEGTNSLVSWERGGEDSVSAQHGIPRRAIRFDEI